MKRLDRGWFSRRSAFYAVALLLLVSPMTQSASSQKATTHSGDALARLMAGNARFVKGQHHAANYKLERQELVKGQHPYAIILSCSDSRVPPEIVFDESLGKLFVIRVAGNVLDPATLGSIEYAAEHLHTKLIFVLGHESCGAVKATIDGGQFSPSIQSIADRIKPAVDAARREHPNAKDLLPFAVQENVALQIKTALEQSTVLKEFIDKKELRIAGGVYHLQTGKVDLVSKDLAAAAH